MYRLWGKIMKNNRFKKDHVFELNQPELSPKQQLNMGIESLAYTFDIQMPMWLSDNEKDFKQFGKAVFTQEHFIEQIEFDYFEVEVIETDKIGK